MVARLAASLSIALALVLAAAPAGSANVSSDAPAGARLLTCHRGPLIAQRVATVSTWMRPIAGGRRLAVKVDLWERTPGERWTLRSDVPGLGTWVTPRDAGVGSRAGDVFKYRQAVGRLEVPAVYRFHVTFRWLDGDGVVVREASHNTAVCREPDLRPDVVLRSVTAAPSQRSPGLVEFTVLVGNEGKSTVARATVMATFQTAGGPSPHRRNVRNLAPGDTAFITFTGPGCAADDPPPTFVADPANSVEESDETNNALAAVCPAP